MIIKSKNILYLFDFDGTLFGQNDWVSLRVNNKAVKKNGPYINPNEHDISWHILTGRPRIDKFFVWRNCHLRGLHPVSINTYPTWFFPNHTPEKVLDYKVSFMRQILMGERTIKGQTDTITK